MDYFLPPVFRGESFDHMPANANWGMDLFGVDYLRSRNPKPIKVGVIDTGIDDTHPLIAPVFKGAWDFTGSRHGYRDANGHGTHCSGTMAGIDPRMGVAAGFELYHGKGLSDSGSGSTSSLINAMNRCIEEGCKVLSCSWGGGGYSASDEREYRRMDDAGVLLVAAAGNSGPNTGNTDYPGRYPYFINVAALGRDMLPASFTSAGDKIDTSWAGVNIRSAQANTGRYVDMSGTSMACPGEGGLLALFISIRMELGLPWLNADAMRKVLFDRSTDTHLPGDDRRTGPGWSTPALLELALTPPPMPLEV